MYEVKDIVGIVLFGAIGLYCLAFWGTALVAWVYGNYLHDGEKKIWSVPEYLRDTRCSGCVMEAYFCWGLLAPMGFAILSIGIYELVGITGMFIPYLFFGLVSGWGLMYVLRSVIRLNKKLDKHARDVDAHKGK